MKKIVFFLLLTGVLSTAYAEEPAANKMNSNNALTKFSRGVTNIATSPGEFVYQMPAAMEQSPDYLTGLLMTLGRGIGYTLLRAGAGIYDVVTAPFPGSTHYGPVMKPEAIVDKVGDTTITTYSQSGKA